jgi:hypothetical protein
MTLGKTTGQKTTRPSFTSKMLITVGILFSLNNTWGQTNKMNNMWHFGVNAVINFSSGTGVGVQPNTSNLYSAEGCATICDKVTGDLLFYTNGVDIWDKNDVMITTSGSHLNGMVNVSVPGHSAAQSCLIIPSPDNSTRSNDTSQYYIFTISDAHSYLPYQNNGLCYSIVEVTASSLNIISLNNPAPLSAGTSTWTTPHLTGIAMTNGNYWIITHGVSNIAGQTNTELRAHELTSSGLNVPVISTGFPVTWLGGTVPDPISNGWQAKASLNCNRAAFSVHNYSTSTGTYLTDETFVYDFDPLTGLFSNEDSYNSGSYGMALSPDGNMLYTVNYNTGTSQTELWQHQLNSHTSTVTDIHGITAPTLGTDENIYLLPDNSQMVGRINDPNAVYAFPSSTSLGYVNSAIGFTAPVQAMYDLPNLLEANNPFRIGIPTIQNLSGVTIVPNPTSGLVQLSIDQLPEKAIVSVEVYSLGGVLVYSTNSTAKQTIDLSRLAQGAYTFKVMYNGRFAAMRIIKL